MLDSRWASIDAFAENNRDNILRDITRLVAVPSVEGTPEPGAPFGKGPKAALDKALEIAAELGLDTHNAEGYIGWAQTGPITDGQKYLATITHTDVVPEGNGWDADPYTVRVRDGWLLGRGVADDKGPSILCLYALKYLKDNGVTLKYPVRALLGANEETNMHDVDYFAAHFEQPAFCFTPDAEFPVCNGEKGGFGGELVSPVLENGVIVDFVGGVAHNAVPDRAACTVRLPESALKQTEGVTFEAGENGTTIIRGWGKSGHAAMPQGTVNAIGLIVTCLLESKVCSPAETSYLQVLHTLHATTDGSALGIAASDDVFDPLTIIGGTIEMKDGRLRQSFDCRYPTSTTAEHLTEMMTQVCGTAATLEDVSSRVPFYIAADSPAIQTLITTYNDVTGENKKPFTMGGGTYARHFPYAVSFGPEHTDIELPEFAGPMHGANEGTPFEKLIEALKIYIDMNFDGLREDVLSMMAGESVPVNTGSFINDMATFRTEDDVLTLLIHLGYLAYDYENKTVRIPNNEIRGEYVNSVAVSEWGEVSTALKNSADTLNAIWQKRPLQVAEGIRQAHFETAHIQYNDENALSYTISLALYAARNFYTVHRELAGGKGFADLVFVPRKKFQEKPALIVELKWDKSVRGAIEQIRQKEYFESLKEYQGNMLLVGINYNIRTKDHECVIEELKKDK